jgi:hypothetical protein
MRWRQRPWTSPAEITARTIKAREANAAVASYLSEHLMGLRVFLVFRR